MNSEEHPLFNLQREVFVAMEDRKLDHTALNKAFEGMVSPATGHLTGKRLRSRQEATSELLNVSVSKNKFLIVRPTDRIETAYKCPMEEDDEDEHGNIVYRMFDDNYMKMECSVRHPGTSEDSDVEEGVDPIKKYPFYSINEMISPITTVAAQHLYGIAFAGPGGIVTELKAAYAMQLSARIDESRRCLNLDCFEYKPRCVDIENGYQPNCIPTLGDMKKFYNRGFIPNMENTSCDDEESDDEDDDKMKEKLKPRKGETFDKDQILQLNYMSCVGNFVDSRCLRVRIPLDKVVGIRLVGRDQQGPGQWGRLDDTEADVGVVLILEISEKLKPDAFAARKVHSRYLSERSFHIIDDWTPNKVASRSTRFYLYGNLAEMKQTAALMAKLCPRLASKLSVKKCKHNTLNTKAFLAYASAPDFGINDATSTSGNEGADVNMDEPQADDVNMDEPQAADETMRNSTSKKGYVMSPDDVHQLLVDANLADDLDDAKENINPCLKRAILMGYVKIDKTSTTIEDTILYKGKCYNCNRKLVCTIGDALHQSTYGDDYADGAEDAGVKCFKCDDPDDGIGNYITGLCINKFEYDSGKFHNHCCECSDFGTCIGDYRNAHCRHCGDHYFRGNSGFPCPSCGNGKSKNVATLPPPPISAWDGNLENAMEVFEAQLSRKEGMEAAMMRMMVLGTGTGGDDDEDSKEDDAENMQMPAAFAAMLAQAMAQGHPDMGGNGNQSGGGGGEECRQM